MSAARADRRQRDRRNRREERRLTLQTTAELWRGLEVVEASIKHGDVLGALQSIESLRALVVVADRVLVDHLRDAEKAAAS
jgi:hypothetical protein